MSEYIKDGKKHQQKGSQSWWWTDENFWKYEENLHHELHIAGIHGRASIGNSVVSNASAKTDTICSSEYKSWIPERQKKKHCDLFYMEVYLEEIHQHLVLSVK